MGSYCSMGMGFVLQDEKDLELCCKTMLIYLHDLTVNLKMVKMLNFTVCDF